MATETYLTSGEMAKLNCVSRKALRVYHEKGLLDSHHVDHETGFAYYDIRQSKNLDMIGRLQSIGMSLYDVKAVQDGQSIERLRDRLGARLADIDDEIARLQQARQVAQEMRDGCELFLRGPMTGQVMLEALPSRRILAFPIADLVDNDHPLSSTQAEWELVLRAVKQRIVDAGLPPALFQNVSSIVPVTGADQAEFEIAEVFVLVDDVFADEVPGTRMLPGGEHLTFYSGQGYNASGMCSSTEIIYRMMDYMRAKGMEPAGDIVEEILFRFPHLISGNGELLWRLCLPVRYA